MSDPLALANALKDAGIERGKAERAVSAIFDAIHDNVATKADVQALGAVLAAEAALLDTRIERLDGAVKAQPKAIMVRMSSLMVVMTGIVLALRYWLPGHG